MEKAYDNVNYSLFSYAKNGFQVKMVEMKAFLYFHNETYGIS